MRTRWFVFTNFDMDWDWRHVMTNNPNLRYVAYGEETTKTGRKHQQGWLYFNNPRMGTRGVTGTMHVEKMMGTMEESDRYCSKENDIVEYGKKPTAGERRDIAETFEAIKEGVSEREIAEANPAQWCQYRRGMAAYREMITPRRTWKTEVIVLWGDSGTGKTKKAWEMAPDAAPVTYTKGDFFIGYNGEADVIIDDFDDTVMPRNIFMTMTDRYPMVANVKGSSVNWAPKRIILTSNYDPAQWYFGHEAVIRRTYTEGTVTQMFG